jgi:hypothetical protein
VRSGHAQVIQIEQTPAPVVGHDFASIGDAHMPTIAHRQRRARELTALAEREPEHRAQRPVDAAAWLLLASRLEEFKFQARVTIKTTATLTAA